jgi:Glycosyl hydrolase family 67 middle domain
LFGAMQKTPLTLEVQITKEYLGQAMHLVYLGALWQEVLDADTYARGEGSTVARVMHYVHGLLRRAVDARSEEQCRLLNAIARLCARGIPAFTDGGDRRSYGGRGARCAQQACRASLLRMLDRDRQRFQLHALLREDAADP